MQLCSSNAHLDLHPLASAKLKVLWGGDDELNSCGLLSPVVSVDECVVLLCCQLTHVNLHLVRVQKSFAVPVVQQQLPRRNDGEEHLESRVPLVVPCGVILRSVGGGAMRHIIAFCCSEINFVGFVGWSNSS
jgi:hypothetical protein